MPFAAQPGGWAAGQRTPGRSTLARAGDVLLLVGGVIQAFGALVLVGFGVLMFILGDLAAQSGPDVVTSTVIGVVYVVLGVLLAIGAVVALVAWSRARRGAAHAPGMLGIVAALLPPVQVVTLLGAIFLLVSDEAKAEKMARPDASAA